MSEYGYCPWCGAPGVSRERRPRGNDTCVRGHVYPSSESLDLPGPVITDDERWAYVRDNLVRGGSPHMDGTAAFRFGVPNGRGRTIDEVIDNLIRQERSE